MAEDDFAPRRISCWNPDGSLAIEKLGGCYYAGHGTYIFPDEPDKAFSMGNLVELDWEKGRWRVTGTPWRALQKNALLGLDYRSEIGTNALHEIGGRRFLVHTASGLSTGRVIVVSEWKDGRAHPLAAVGACGQAITEIAPNSKGGFEPPPAFADHLWTEPRMNEIARDVIPWFFHGPLAGEARTAYYWAGSAIWQKSKLKGTPKTYGRPNANFIWCDLNGNGLQDEGEITYHATPGLEGPLPTAWGPQQWSHGVADKNLSLYLSAVQDGMSYHFRLPISRWAESGSPVYEPEKAELIVATPYLGEVAYVND